MQLFPVELVDEIGRFDAITDAHGDHFRATAQDETGGLTRILDAPKKLEGERGSLWQRLLDWHRDDWRRWWFPGAWRKKVNPGVDVFR